MTRLRLLVVAAIAAWCVTPPPALGQDAGRAIRDFDEQVEEATEAVDAERAAETDAEASEADEAADADAPPEGLLPADGGAATTAADVPLTANRMFSTMPGRGKKGGTYVEVRPFGNYAFEADLDGGGDFTVGRAGIQLRTEYWLERFLTLTFDVNYERSDYGFDGTLALDAPSTLDNATRVTLRPGARMALSRELQVFAGLGLEYTGENGTDIDDALVVSGFAGGRWAWRDDVAFTFGISAQQDIEEDFMAFPILGVRWDITDLWRLDVGGALGGFQGQIGYTPVEAWTLAGALRFENRDFRLDEDNPNPLGVLRDNRLIAEVTATYRPTAWSEVTAGVGSAVWSNLTIETSNGNELLDTEADPALFISLRGRIRF